MRAEEMATEYGPGLRWHALDHEGRALCGRPLNSKSILTLVSALDREDYCRRCMKDVAAAIRASLVGAPSDAQHGERRA
ncbi:hypothetical protein ABZ070_31695 [Streptomyces sp. NPDC006283]|uniref:hypothetical protein n=1 Tax=Streptomyces sp. NPDC006283 TaxID=3156741 RepID=UPI0033ADA58F